MPNGASSVAKIDDAEFQANFRFSPVLGTEKEDSDNHGDVVTIVAKERKKFMGCPNNLRGIESSYCYPQKEAVRLAIVSGPDVRQVVEEAHLSMNLMPIP